MEDNDTIIVVGQTEKDGYGNLWATPQGKEDAVKISYKRQHLHHLFEQGKAIILHWETYKGKPYVANARLVEGELPEGKPIETPQPQEPLSPQAKPPTPAAQAVGMTVKEIGEMVRAGASVGKLTAVLTTIFGGETAFELLRWYRSQILGTTRITFDGEKLPKFKGDK